MLNSNTSGVDTQFIADMMSHLAVREFCPFNSEIAGSCFASPNNRLDTVTHNQCSVLNLTPVPGTWNNLGALAPSPR